MNFIHKYYPIFSYFAEQLGEPLEWWADKKVFDFGGNSGNVLRDPRSTIQPKNYCCLDIMQAGLEKGKQDYPDGKWLHYNRYNLLYNFDGNRDEPFPIFEEQFDVILVFSVLTMTPFSEMKRTINEELLPLLKPGGVLMNTYLSTATEIPIRVFTRKGFGDVEKFAKQSATLDHFYMVGGNEMVLSEEGLSREHEVSMLSYYSDDFIKANFPNWEIQSFVCDGRCVADQLQHCMIYRSMPA